MGLLVMIRVRAQRNMIPTALRLNCVLPGSFVAGQILGLGNSGADQNA
jgi:hypothetical protein